MKHPLIATLIAVALCGCTGSVTDNLPTYGYTESGTLVRNLPGLTPGAWYLRYKEADGSEMTMRLSFDDAECIQGETRNICERTVFKQGLDVEIRGEKDASGAAVDVREMTVAQ